MALNVSTTLRNAWMDSILTVAGNGALLRLRTGAKPANAAAARSGTVLVSIDLGSSWLGAASSAVATLSGTPSGTAAATGTIGHWEIMKSDTTTCVLQGTITTEGVTVDTTTVSSTGQTIRVTSGTFTAGSP